MSRFNDNIMRLLELANQENEPGMYMHSNEYDELWYKVDTKSMAIDGLEKKLKCPIEVIAEANEYGIWVNYQGHFYHIEPENLNISIRDDISILQELYFEDLDCVMDTTGAKFFGDKYMINWWIKKDKSR